MTVPFASGSASEIGIASRHRVSLIANFKGFLLPQRRPKPQNRITTQIQKEKPAMSDSRSFHFTAFILLFVAFGIFACKHRQTAAAPTPPPAPAATAPVRTAAAPSITVRSDRPAITRGQSATLTITTQNATSVTIEPGVGNVPVNGSRQVSPSSSVTYVATAMGRAETPQTACASP